METPTASTSLNIQQDSETISQQGIFHFAVQNEFSLLINLKTEGENCLYLWFLVIYVKIKNKIS